jgi:hypothetical protein
MDFFGFGSKANVKSGGGFGIGSKLGMASQNFGINVVLRGFSIISKKEIDFDIF